MYVCMYMGFVPEISLFVIVFVINQSNTWDLCYLDTGCIYCIYKMNNHLTISFYSSTANNEAEGKKTKSSGTVAYLLFTLQFPNTATSYIYVIF